MKLKGRPWHLGKFYESDREARPIDAKTKAAFVTHGKGKNAEQVGAVIMYPTTDDFARFFIWVDLDGNESDGEFSKASAALADFADTWEKDRQ